MAGFSAFFFVSCSHLSFGVQSLLVWVAGVCPEEHGGIFGPQNSAMSRFQRRDYCQACILEPLVVVRPRKRKIRPQTAMQMPSRSSASRRDTRRPQFFRTAASTPGEGTGPTTLRQRTVAGRAPSRGVPRYAIAYDALYRTLDFQRPLPTGHVGCWGEQVEESGNSISLAGSSERRPAPWRRRRCQDPSGNVWE